MKTELKTIYLLSIISIVLLYAPSSYAQTFRQIYQNATGVCRGATSAGESGLAFRATGIQNVSSSTVVLNCSLGKPVYYLFSFSISFYNPNSVAKIVSCTGYIGSESSPEAVLTISKSINIPAGGKASIEWSDSEVGGKVGTPNASCNIPTKVVVGLTDTIAYGS